MKLILDFAFITAFLVNLVIIYLLANNSDKKLHKQVLQFIFLLVAIYLSCSYAILHKIKYLYYGTVIFYETIATFLGPLILLYIKSLFLPRKGLIKKNSVNFVLPILHLIINTVVLILTFCNLENLFPCFESYEKIRPLLITYSLFYCIISLEVLKKAETLIKHNYSNLEGVDLKWIHLFLIGTIVVMSVDISTTVYELLFGDLEWNTLYLTSIGAAFLVVYLGYYGVLQSRVLISPFLLVEENSSPITTTEEKQIKPTSNPINFELDRLEQQLNSIMHDQEAFLDENLSLKSLAELLGISDKKLSALLNQHMQISFYDYVNGFRVNSVIDKMKDPSFDKFTLLSIAFESGFKSKTSFNRTFKKATNLSPSEYKKQL